MKNKYNCISVLSITKAIFVALLVVLPVLVSAQQSPSIQTGVTFQWANTQSSNSNAATIQSVTIGGVEYNTFVVPSSYEMTRLGPNGNGANNIKENGSTINNSSANANWNSMALLAFQDKNLNHYFEASSNGRNICSNFNAIQNTSAQKQTIFYSPAIPANQDGVLAVTERGGNNCFYVEIWGIPADGGLEQKLGETFVRNSGDYRNCTFAPPVSGSDYWQSGRCNENGQTVGVGLFYLSDIAPVGSKITKIEFVGATSDHGDGKFFLLQKYAVDQQSMNCIDNKYDGDLSKNNNVPDNSTYSIVNGPTPSGQSFTLNSDGTYEYVPPLGYIGDVTFEYEVCLPAPNSTVCDRATVTLQYVDLPEDPQFTIICDSTYDDFIISIDSPLGSEYEYTIDGSTYQDSPVFNNLTQGAYNLVVRNKFIGCTTASSSNPIVLNPLQLSGVVTDVLCKLENTGSIDISVSGGSPPYTYLWANSATSQDISGVFAATYTVTVTDANGCSISENYTVNEPVESLTSTISSTTNVLCNGENTGEIDLTISGGTAPYTVLWNNNSTNQNQSGLTAGDYDVIITDANGCTTTNQTTITQPNNALIASITDFTNADCNGNETGNITVEGSGGTPPYNYSIDAGTTSQTNGLFENLAADNYVILVTDSNDCSTTVNTSILQPIVLGLSISNVNDVDCTGEATGDITITVSGGTLPYSYSWSNSSMNQNLTDVIAGSYSVTVTDANGCSVSANTTISEPSSPLSLNISKVDANTAQGCINGEATADVSGGTSPYTYLWSASANNQTGANATNLSVGTHSVTVTDANNCQLTQSIVIVCTNTCDAEISIDNTTNVSCVGDATGSGTVLASSNANPGATFTFTWSNGQVDSGVTTSTISNVTAGVYDVSVTIDGTVCQPVEETISITEPNNALNLTSSSTDELGPNTGDGTASSSATGGVDPYTYLWSPGGETTQNITGLAAGTFTVTVTDANGCTDINTVTVNPGTCNNLSISGTSTPVVCNGENNGSVTALVSNGIGPFNYSWDTLTDTTPNVSGLPAGNYTVTVTDQTTLCTQNTTITINEPNALSTGIAVTNILCKDDTTGSVDLTVNGGTSPYTFLWNTGAVTEDLINVVAGTYSVTVTDANGCTATNQSTVNEPAENVSGSITQITNAECLGENTGSITAEGAGGIPPYSYSRDNGSTSQSSDLFENLAAGNYTILITDANGCMFSTNGTIETDDIEGPEITVPSTITIEGCSIANITNGNAVFTYNSTQSGDVQSTFASNATYNASDDFNIQSITYIDVITSTDNCPITVLRTFTITDNCNNTATATQTITVQDTTTPSLTLPSDVTIECTEDETSANTGIAGGMDNCSTVSITESDNVTAACGNTKTIIRTWTATDECGNTTSADQTITVTDTTPPTIIAPADVTIECTEDESSANTGVATGADTCGDVTISQSDAINATCGNTKTIIRTWTATDECGNTASANQTITVQDTTPPTITAPTDITIECTEDESSANTGLATGTDSCGTVTISQSDDITINCGNTRTITRTWTATDVCGNVASTDQIITVQDTTPPTITAPTDITIECTEDESSTNTGVATGIDTCGTVTISQSDDVTTACGNTRTIIRTWTATDACGNATSADQTIIIQDTTPPTITVPANITIECTDDESSANTGIATGADTCGDVTISQSDAITALCGNTKTITRTWTATDNCGNTTSANQTITVQDTTPPTITAPADVTIECTEDESSTNTGIATGSDTCGDVTISQSDVETAACGNTKTIIRTWTATDECGNATSANQTITVQDTTPPTITVPADITIECTEDESSANTGIATGADTCGTVTITQSDFEVTTCGNAKTITRTWTATDACGNTTSADQTITVQDTTPPTITAPADVTIECTEDESSANTGAATGSDTCGDLTISQSDVETEACGNTKTIIRTWTATDACGNATSADQTITVQDTTPPTITLPADITIECTEDESSANTGIATGADTCGTVTITHSDFEVTACGNAKTITRTWTATDACGNTTSADQTITVQDTTPPTITAPADVTIECTEDESSANTGAATGSDTCGDLTISQSDVETEACGNTKTIIRTWTATDACGNATSANQTITVQDTTPPTISVPADITIECTEDESSANTGLATGSDTCGTVTITQSDSEVAACGNTKTITRTWTATDACGNATSTDQIITVQDTTPPTIDNSGIQNIDIQCGVTPDGTLEAWLLNNAGANATDTCGNVTWSNDYGANTAVDCASGAITVIFTATDDCGNTDSTTATYSIIDTVSPVLNIPADLTIECTEGTTPANTGTATATDDCAAPNISFSDAEVAACGNTKTITRTWTATDACGNTTSADQTITIQDATPPTITVPADITIECTEDESSANTGIATGSDTCGTVTITQSDSEVAACGNTKTITRTWTATDACGNATSADQTITVQDTTPPTITVPADITIECTDDESSANTGLATGTDTCGTVTITQSDSEVAACGNTKTITRTWTATDACGNATSADQTITVQDTIPPTITVPADITIECTVDESSANTGIATGTDTCGTVTITQSDSEVAACGNTKTITRTWTATDACGNATSTDQIITVQDTTPPTIDNSGIQNIDIQCGVTPDGTLEAWLLNNAGANATDTCGNVTWSNDYGANTAVDCASGAVTVIFTATDDCGNTDSTTATYSIIDTVSPVLNIPADLTIECTEDTTPANTGNATATDDCAAPNISFSDAEVAACGNTKTIIRTWTATDACGNTTSADQTITVQDTTPPTITVPADVTIECTEDESSANTGIATGSDTCGTVTITQSDSEVAACGNTKTITRTWTATDACGNTTSADQTIIIQDITPPTFSAPADLTIECDVDAMDLTITGDVTDETDNCSAGLDATYSDSIADGNCDNEFVITRTWSLTDTCDNATTLIQTITIQDTTAPTFDVDLPTDTTLECDAIPSIETITATDNCGDATVTVVESTTTGSCDNEYTLIRIWTATDACGNETSHSQTITVQDTTAPSFNETLPADIDVECDAVPEAETLTATDNCSTTEVTFEEEITNGACIGDYIIVRTWSAIDTCENEAVHTQIITVQDTTAPALVTSFDENITVACDEIPSIPDLVFEDSCSNNISVDFNEASTQINDFESYQIIRTWAVIDDCGNEEVFTQTINVEISNVVNVSVANRCVLDIEFDLFDLLSGDFSMDGTWNVITGNTTLNGSFFDPSTAEVGVYTFLYAITEGPCPREVEVNVAIDDDCLVLPCSSEDNILISKAVTANGDMVNDTFTVESIEQCGFVIELQIFNRWGAEIYKSYNYQNDWGGEAHGSSAGNSGKVPTGTYYYIINIKNSGLAPFTGPIYVATN